MLDHIKHLFHQIQQYIAGFHFIIKVRDIQIIRKFNCLMI
jgi:hypothetical protein